MTTSKGLGYGVDEVVLAKVQESVFALARGRKDSTKRAELSNLSEAKTRLHYRFACRMMLSDRQD